MFLGSLQMRYLLALVRTFGLFYASVLRTCATGGQGHRTGTEDEREVRMYQADIMAFSY